MLTLSRVVSGGLTPVTRVTGVRPPTWILVVAFGGMLLLGAPVEAQLAPKGGPDALEVFAGHAGFVDDATIHHAVFGGAGRFYITPRVSLGPEITYMRGPDLDRDLFVMGNLTWDMVPPRAGGRPARVTPFLSAGGGFFLHKDRYLDSWGSEGSFSAGGGVRVWLTDRAYALVDLRIGWELHTRISGGVGIGL
jgi:hypothetical protein